MPINWGIKKGKNLAEVVGKIDDGKTLKRW